jgi:hypothetical protein
MIMSAEKSYSAHRHSPVKVISIFLFLALAFFPIINDLTGLFAEKAPKGTRLPKASVPLNYQTFLHRKWQEQMQGLAKKRSGLWLYGVQLGNELYLRLFHQTSAFPSDFPYNLTKDGALFKMEHLNGFNRDQNFDPNHLTEQVKNLKSFQDLMTRKGKTTLFVITPNLLSLYPELNPDEFTRPDRLTRRDYYEDLLSALDSYQVNYVDTQSLLLSTKDNFPFRLFTTSASHWNDVASCNALSAVNDKLWQIGKGFRKFSCEKWNVKRIPEEKDQDLAITLNLFNISRFISKTPYVEIKYTSEPVDKKPTVLAVGTSYLSAFMEHMHKWDLAEKTTMYFYFRRQKVNGWRSFVTLDKNKINWGDILNSDIILLNVGMSDLGNIGYGFVEDAIKHGNLQ